MSIRSADPVRPSSLARRPVMSKRVRQHQQDPGSGLFDVGFADGGRTSNRRVPMEIDREGAIRQQGLDSGFWHSEARLGEPGVLTVVRHGLVVGHGSLISRTSPVNEKPRRVSTRRRRAPMPRVVFVIGSPDLRGPRGVARR